MGTSVHGMGCDLAKMACVFATMIPTTRSSTLDGTASKMSGANPMLVSLLRVTTRGCLCFMLFQSDSTWSTNGIRLETLTSCSARTQTASFSRRHPGTCLPLSCSSACLTAAPSTTSLARPQISSLSPTRSSSSRAAFSSLSPSCFTSITTSRLSRTPCCQRSTLSAFASTARSTGHGSPFRKGTSMFTQEALQSSPPYDISAGTRLANVWEA
mmetsp:Transcript_72145/g.169781  ORF Transcript_72145/g.169781 Transcript_72145/m.169781 type:complete len:213 (-) Transcript_72145:197-835(-)